MNSFLELLINLLRVSLLRTIITIAICGVIFVIYSHHYKTKYGKYFRISRKKVMLSMMLIAYLSVLLYVTVQRYMGGGHAVNTHLFRAWRRAWNQVSITVVLNPILNVVVFVPFGILIPMMWKRFRRWTNMLALASLFSLYIEIIQYLKCSGIADIDDLFCNTLGAMLGYCILKSIQSAVNYGKQRNRWIRSGCYAILPISSFVILGIMFYSYSNQPYGNLPNAADYKLNTNQIIWNVDCILQDDPALVPIYKGTPMNQESCDQFGAMFFDRLGVAVERTDYYDQSTWLFSYSDGYHLLIVSHLDGSYEYSTSSQEMDCLFVRESRETIQTELEKFNIHIPEAAQFYYEGDGYHCFDIDRYSNGSKIVDGSIRCQYAEGDGICYVENRMVAYEICGEVSIMSPRQAYERLCAGYFASELGFEDLELENVEVMSCELDYQVDTKGYYQPVYLFELSSIGYTEKVMIPGLA